MKVIQKASLTLGYDAKAWHDCISKTYVVDDSSLRQDQGDSIV